MPKVYVVAGASGSGKTFFLRNAEMVDSNLIRVRKLTTRSQRPSEKKSEIDLLFGHTEEQIKKCDYRYAYYGNWYGLNRSDIDAVLDSGKSPIIIIRSGKVIKEIKEDYKDVVVIYLHTTLSGNDLANKLRDQGRQDIDIDERMARAKDDFSTYIKLHGQHVFDYLFVNNYEPEGLLSQLETIIEIENKTTPENNFVFVLMSFNPKLQAYYEAFKDTANFLSGPPLKITRADEEIGDFNVTDKVLELIRKSQILVCDLTEERPNVYYELGYARGIGKTVLHCAKVGTKLHFDIKDVNTIFYDNPDDARDKLIPALAKHFKRDLK